MNLSLLTLEFVVTGLGLVLLIGDLWTPPAQKAKWGYFAAAVLILLFLGTFATGAGAVGQAFAGMFVQDSLALFFKRFFLLAGAIVLVISVESAEQIQPGLSEFFSLTLFALVGMLFAASANDLVMVFVSLELITVSFYILNSFQRRRVQSLEAGIKYLILGALSSAFLVYGIALIFATANTTNFDQLLAVAGGMTSRPLFLAGVLLVLAGIGFKLAAFPFQVWAPDVYQGAPTPAVAFLAVGSKAAGVVLLLRVLFSALPAIAGHWLRLLMGISAVTILYGNLCAIPQRNLKRLLGYSSISHAGYILLGVAAMNLAGSSAILFYLTGYLFTVLAAFAVISLVMRGLDMEDLSAVSGLNQRSPLLAGALAMAMISLAGIPPLAGFFGKFLLIRAAVEQGAQHPGFYRLIGIAIAGVLISFYYYLGVVRAIYWSAPVGDAAPIPVPNSMRAVLWICVAGMLYLGLFPNAVMNWATTAAKVLYK